MGNVLYCGRNMGRQVQRRGCPGVVMTSEVGVERPTTLPLQETPAERHVHFSDVETRPAPATPSPRKPRPDPDFRPKRKRSLSFSGCGGGEYYRGNKRRKRGRVLPSKFLLGGSITDPLNLGSLDDDEETPPVCKGDSGSGSGTSGNRRWAAVRVIIPPNINDPLNLDASSDNEDLLTDAFNRSIRRRRRSRKRKRRLSEPGDCSNESSQLLKETEVVVRQRAASPHTRHPTTSLKPLTVNTDLTAAAGSGEARRDGPGPSTPTGTKQPGTPGSGGPPRIGAFKKQRSKSDNKIVSPVIPQPGGERKRHPSHNRHHADKPHLSQQNLQPPAAFNPKNEVFQYGNYNKYYGYRNPASTADSRLQYIRREWCQDREVLDVGCNIGHIALTIARDYAPKRVVGIDIDKKLINIANKNIKHYLRQGDPEEATFPSSMRLLYGPLKTPVRADGTRSFPYNIKFIHANYVLESDELLETVRPEFDLILCLSITKWIHLNWGDQGLKRFFRRCFHNLNPGGRLVLEPQAWPSYNKRRKLTKRIFDNYKSIRLFPDKFNDFLLHDVGFSTSEKMGTPYHMARGFQRPIIVYTKAGGSSKCSPSGEGVGKEASTSQSGEKCQEVAVEESSGTTSADVPKNPPDSSEVVRERTPPENSLEKKQTFSDNKDNVESKIPDTQENVTSPIGGGTDRTLSYGVLSDTLENTKMPPVKSGHICDNNVAGESGHNDYIIHSSSSDTCLKEQCASAKHLVIKDVSHTDEEGSLRSCTNLNNKSTESFSSFEEGAASAVLDGRTVSKLNSKCSGDRHPVEREDSKSPSTIIGTQSDQKCINSLISYVASLTKENSKNIGTHAISAVNNSEVDSKSGEEIVENRGVEEKRQHPSSEGEGGDSQADRWSKKLKLGDT